jgi:hypothetical protein
MRSSSADFSSFSMPSSLLDGFELLAQHEFPLLLGHLLFHLPVDLRLELEQFAFFAQEGHQLEAPFEQVEGFEDFLHAAGIDGQHGGNGVHEPAGLFGRELRDDHLELFLEDGVHRQHILYRGDNGHCVRPQFVVGLLVGVLAVFYLPARGGPGVAHLPGALKAADALGNQLHGVVAHGGDLEHLDGRAHPVERGGKQIFLVQFLHQRHAQDHRLALGGQPQDFEVLAAVEQDGQREAREDGPLAQGQDREPVGQYVGYEHQVVAGAAGRGVWLQGFFVKLVGSHVRRGLSYDG